MTPDVVVDIGNSRMKWGRCLVGRDLQPVAFSLDQRDWQIVAREFGLTFPVRWVVASVNPGVLAQFVDWVAARGDAVFVLERRQIQLPVNVDNPDAVGVDRLLGALAARAHLSPKQPGIVISVGTAMTVDLIDAEGVFQGGAILPGPQLMFRSLHEHTAQLPLIYAEDVGQPHPGYHDQPPGKNTQDAMVAGVTSAIQGAAQHLVGRMSASPVHVTITGGNRHYLDGTQFQRARGVRIADWLTLEGIRIAAEALP